MLCSSGYEGDGTKGPAQEAGRPRCPVEFRVGQSPAGVSHSPPVAWVREGGRARGGQAQGKVPTSPVPAARHFFLYLLNRPAETGERRY